MSRLLLVAALSVGLCLEITKGAIAAPSLTPRSDPHQETVDVSNIDETEPTQTAQLFYPPGDQQQVIAVTGQGRASVPADTAQIRFSLANRDPAAAYQEPTATSAPPPLTEASLQPLIAALQQAGVASEAIQSTVNPSPSPNPYGPGGAVITVDLTQPNQAQVQRLIAVVRDRASTTTSGTAAPVFVRKVDVTYAVDSCQAVETAAYGSAVADAQLRAEAIATSLGVSLVNPPAVAELPFIGRFYTPCSTEPDIVDAVFGQYTSSYNPEMKAEVEVYRELAVTYRIQR